MQRIVKINNSELPIKEWNGKRVVTLADVDRVHQRPTGTAKRNFNENRKRLILNEEYFLVTRKELSTNIVPNDKPLKGNPNIEVVLLTKYGYLLLVKSFTDDLAWDVQRDLVNSYFRLRDVIQSTEDTSAGLILPQDRFNAAIDTIQSCAKVFEGMIDFVTINYKQQITLNKLARERIRILLGDTQSVKYIVWSRTYFKNLWLNFCEHFEIGAYRDLAPDKVPQAIEYIQAWTYNH